MRDTIARRGEKDEESLGWGTAKDEEKTTCKSVQKARYWARQIGLTSKRKTIYGIVGANL